MEWKYVKQLNNNPIIDIEKQYNIKLSENLKRIINKYNGGRPEKNIFSTDNNKQRVIKSLLSYNKTDKENIYMFTEIFDKGYIPVFITEFGDVISIKSNSEEVYIYLHEKDSFDYICEDIEKFIERLYI